MNISAGFSVNCLIVERVAEQSTFQWASSSREVKGNRSLTLLSVSASNKGGVTNSSVNRRKHVFSIYPRAYRLLK